MSTDSFPLDPNRRETSAPETIPASTSRSHPSSEPRRDAQTWAGIFDDLPEVDTDVHDIEGRLPDGLVGTLYRNGPGNREHSASFFDGHGLIRSLRIERDGAVHFRTRFVETRKYVLERARGRAVQRTAGTNLPGGILRNFLRIPGHEANTHVVEHGGRLLALEESGQPYELDPTTLETRAMVDFDGALRRPLPYSAHPHRDPHTGETFNFGLDFASLRPAVQTLRADAQGRVERRLRTPLPHASFVHDFALSERYMIFHVAPLYANIARFALGLDSFFGSLSWRPERASRFLLLPRTGGPVVEIEADAFFTPHFLGAWDDGDGVIVEAGHFGDWAGVANAAAEYDTSDWSCFSAGTQWRYRLDPVKRTVTGECLCPLPADFPRLAPDAEASPSRWGYAAANSREGEGGLYRAVVKIDRHSGNHELFDFGPDKVSLEPVFAPRPGSAQEDDGWLLCLVYDGRRRTSDLAILDARRPSDGPVCTLALPVSAGATFHGSWWPAEA